MYTLKTFEILGNCVSEIQDHTIEGIEHLHLRGAMFGYYKRGSGAAKVEGRWPDKGLQLIKPGKLIKMMYDGYSDAQVEKFVNRIKAYISAYGDEHGEGIEAPVFSIASGGLISHYYLEDNYVEKRGNLGNSCMRYASCQPYFKLYERNDDAVSMLVLRNSDHVIVARALLWFDGTDTYMDTIYHIADKYVESMIDYACKHGIYYKKQQSCHYFAFDMLNRQRIQPKIVRIPINNIEISSWEFPWLDTLMYGSLGEDGVFYLSNTLTTDTDTDGVYSFRSTSGSISELSVDDDRLLHMETAFALLYDAPQSPSVKAFLETRDELVKAVASKDSDVVEWNNGLLATVIKDHDYSSRRYRKLFVDNEPDEGKVEINGEFYDEEDCVIDYHGNWVHQDDAVCVDGDWYHTDDNYIRYSESRGEYYLAEDVTWVETRQDYYLNDDTVWDEYNDESILDRDSVYVEDYGYVHEDDVDEVAVLVNGEYHKIDECFQCQITDEWYLNKEEHQLPDGRSVCEQAYNDWMAENDTDEEEVEEQP
jgi:hypothetical protein